MRLGWFSRLGIVLTAFGLPTTTSYFAFRQLSGDQKLRDSNRETCLAIAREDKGAGELKASDACWDQWANAPNYAGSIWKEAFAFTAVLFATLWIIALAIYWSVVWTLAGRRRTAKAADQTPA